MSHRIISGWVLFQLLWFDSSRAVHIQVRPCRSAEFRPFPRNGLMPLLLFLSTNPLLGREELLEAPQDALPVARQSHAHALQLTGRQLPAFPHSSEPQVLESRAVLFEAEAPKPLMDRLQAFCLGRQHGFQVKPYNTQSLCSGEDEFRSSSGNSHLWTRRKTCLN